MTRSIPSDFVELFHCQALMHVATADAAGQPHVTPVWADYDGTYILVNTVEGRVKYRHLLERPEVAISIVDPRHWGRFISVRGRVVEIERNDANEHID